jgi:hypothetical protein
MDQPIPNIREMQGIQPKYPQIFNIGDIRQLVKANSPKIDGGTISPDILAMISMYIDYNIFLINNVIYSEDELEQHFHLIDGGHSPTMVCRHQLIGLYPINDTPNSIEDFECVMKDDNDTTPFIRPTDMPPGPTAPACIVGTRVYIGRHEWKDVMLIKQVMRACETTTTLQLGNSDTDIGRQLQIINQDQYIHKLESKLILLTERLDIVEQIHKSPPVEAPVDDYLDSLY